MTDKKQMLIEMVEEKDETKRSIIQKHGSLVCILLRQMFLNDFPCEMSAQLTGCVIRTTCQLQLQEKMLQPAPSSTGLIN